MAGVNVKLNKSAALYHAIQVFLNMNIGKAEPNGAFKIRFDNVYETMYPSGGENILLI